MLTKRKKLSKKEIKEDTLVTTYYKVYGYFEENRNRIFMYAGILVVAAAAIFFYISNKNKNNDIAGTQLARIMPLYDGGSYLEAIEGKAGSRLVGLKKIVEEYGSTENGEIAKIYLANSYSHLGKLEDSKKFYEDYSGSNKIFKATALAGEAAYFASKNQYEEAADLYKKAANVSEENALNPDYLLRAAINYINAGKKDQAIDYLKKIKKDYNTSSAFREVDRYLTTLEN